MLKQGKITTYKDNTSPTCKLIINKTDLQEVLFPLLVQHKIFFLTDTRRGQFHLAEKKNVKLYKQIPDKKSIPALIKLPETPLHYTKLFFF